MLKRTLAALSLTALPATALAQPTSECATDGDCPDGFTCEVTGGSSCACAPNTPCDCQTVEYRSCVPGPCASDADCAEGFVCATYEVPCADVSTPPCLPDGTCPEAPPAPPCEPTTQSVCAPRWVLPCETADDCGAGFTCEPVETCTCSGGAATDPPSSGGGDSGSGYSGSETPPPEPPPDSSCTCEPSGTNACVAIEVACTDASACPSGWSCQQMTTGVACVEPEGGSSDGSQCPPPEPPSTSGVCVPPYGESFDAGLPRDASSDTPQYESGGATATPSPTDGATPGTHTPAAGCAGGASALPISGLALLLVAAWRRRALRPAAD